MPPPTFGTHDLELLSTIVEQRGAQTDDFEVAMLYGIRTADLRQLAAEGYRTSVLISYGSEWAAWYMRRLAERPANLAFAMTAVVRR